MRFADFVSVFPAGINAAATFDENLIYRRGVAMGEEFRGKGVNVALVPMMNLARAPAAGRNWEGCEYRSFKFPESSLTICFGQLEEIRSSLVSLLPL